jgi:hypothetical protein
MTAGMVYLVQLAPPAFLGQQTPSLAVTHLIRGCANGRGGHNKCCDEC